MRGPMKVRLLGAERDLGTLPNEVRSDALAITQWLAKGAKSSYRSSKRNRRGNLASDACNQTINYGGGFELSSSSSHTDRDRRKRLVSDIANDLSAIRAVKRLRISDERGTAVERAMANTPDCPFSSLAELEDAINKWAEATFCDFDANAYYDQNRAEGYQTNKDIQQRLTDRALDCLGIGRTDDVDDGQSKTLVLDIACGSGLSTGPILNRLGARRSFVVGFDLSLSMLSRAINLMHGYADFVLHDMKQPLPFRDSAFDKAVSISAAHYLSSSERAMNTLYSGIRRVVKPTPSACRSIGDHSVSSTSTSAGAPNAVLQFFPVEPVLEPLAIARAARISKWGGVTQLLDQTHHTKSYRWYLCLSHEPNDTPPEKCGMYLTEHASCLLCVHVGKRVAPEEHITYCVAEHCRFLHKLFRTQRFNTALLDSNQQALIKSAAASLGLCPKEGVEETFTSVPSLEELKRLYWSKLHPVLHRRDLS